MIHLRWINCIYCFIPNWRVQVNIFESNNDNSFVLCSHISIMDQESWYRGVTHKSDTFGKCITLMCDPPIFQGWRNTVFSFVTLIDSFINKLWNVKNDPAFIKVMEVHRLFYYKYSLFHRNKVIQINIQENEIYKPSSYCSIFCPHRLTPEVCSCNTMKHILRTMILTKW